MTTVELQSCHSVMVAFERLFSDGNLSIEEEIHFAPSIIVYKA